MGNPILIKKKPQKGEIKSKIDTHPAKARNRAIVNLSNIAIIIYNSIEDSVPSDERGNEVTNEKGT
jgi:predicted Fe-Mo cluster-binding NifX family protein